MCEVLAKDTCNVIGIDFALVTLLMFTSKLDSSCYYLKKERYENGGLMTYIG